MIDIDKSLFEVLILTENGEALSGLYSLNALPYVGQLILVKGHQLKVRNVILDLRQHPCVYGVITTPYVEIKHEWH